jgi:hypothetical protein
MSESEDILSQPSDSNKLIDDLTCLNLNVHSTKKSQRSKNLKFENLMLAVIFLKFKILKFKMLAVIFSKFEFEFTFKKLNF